MALKDTILEILESNRDTYTSGQQLATITGVSRAAIWKAINSLKEQGYHIDSVTNKGYKFASSNNILSSGGIVSYLDKDLSCADIIVHKTIDSTNAESKRLALSGAKEYTVVVAEEQTLGRGRLGRSFYSPTGTGIYMSVILRPHMDLSSGVLITTGASVAVCKAIEKVTSFTPSIKWINDIYLNNKKICGILTEAISDFETGNIDSIILGIGVNVSTKTDDLPDDIKSTAGCISNDIEINRNRLTAEILNELKIIYDNLAPGSYISDYKSRSMLLGKDIFYIQNNEKKYCTAIDINETGGLVVKNTNGDITTLSSGEVSVRLNNKPS